MDYSSVCLTLVHTEPSNIVFTLLFSHLADGFIQSDLQIRKST